MINREEAARHINVICLAAKATRFPFSPKDVAGGGATGSRGGCHHHHSNHYRSSRHSQTRPQSTASLLALNSVYSRSAAAQQQPQRFPTARNLSSSPTSSFSDATVTHTTAADVIKAIEGVSQHYHYAPPHDVMALLQSPQRLFLALAALTADGQRPGMTVGQFWEVQDLASVLLADLLTGPFMEALQLIVMCRAPGVMPLLLQGLRLLRPSSRSLSAAAAAPAGGTSSSDGDSDTDEGEQAGAGAIGVARGAAASARPPRELTTPTPNYTYANTNSNDDTSESSGAGVNRRRRHGNSPSRASVTRAMSMHTLPSESASATSVNVEDDNNGGGGEGDEECFTTTGGGGRLQSAAAPAVGPATAPAATLLLPPPESHLLTSGRQSPSLYSMIDEMLAASSATDMCSDSGSTAAGGNVSVIGIATVSAPSAAAQTLSRRALRRARRLRIALRSLKTLDTFAALQSSDCAEHLTACGVVPLLAGVVCAPSDRWAPVSLALRTLHSLLVTMMPAGTTATTTATAATGGGGGGGSMGHNHHSNHSNGAAAVEKLIREESLWIALMRVVQQCAWTLTGRAREARRRRAEEARKRWLQQHQEEHEWRQEQRHQQQRGRGAPQPFCVETICPRGGDLSGDSRRSGSSSGSTVATAAAVGVSKSSSASISSVATPHHVEGSGGSGGGGTVTGETRASKRTGGQANPPSIEALLASVAVPFITDPPPLASSDPSVGRGGSPAEAAVADSSAALEDREAELALTLALRILIPLVAELPAHISSITATTSTTTTWPLPGGGGGGGCGSGAAKPQLLFPWSQVVKTVDPAVWPVLWQTLTTCLMDLLRAFHGRDWPQSNAAPTATALGSAPPQQLLAVAELEVRLLSLLLRLSALREFQSTPPPSPLLSEQHHQHQRQQQPPADAPADLSHPVERQEQQRQALLEAAALRFLMHDSFPPMVLSWLQPRCVAGAISPASLVAENNENDAGGGGSGGAAVGASVARRIRTSGPPTPGRDGSDHLGPSRAFSGVGSGEVAHDGPAALLLLPSVSELATAVLDLFLQALQGCYRDPQVRRALLLFRASPTLNYAAVPYGSLLTAERGGVGGAGLAAGAGTPHMTNATTTTVQTATARPESLLFSLLRIILPEPGTYGSDYAASREPFGPSSSGWAHQPPQHQGQEVPAMPPTAGRPVVIGVGGGISNSSSVSFSPYSTLFGREDDRVADDDDDDDDDDADLHLSGDEIFLSGNWDRRRWVRPAAGVMVAAPAPRRRGAGEAPSLPSSPRSGGHSAQPHQQQRRAANGGVRPTPSPRLPVHLRNSAAAITRIHILAMAALRLLVGGPHRLPGAAAAAGAVGVREEAYPYAFVVPGESVEMGPLRCLATTPTTSNSSSTGEGEDELREVIRTLAAAYVHYTVAGLTHGVSVSSGDGGLDGDGGSGVAAEGGAENGGGGVSELLVDLEDAHGSGSSGAYSPTLANSVHSSPTGRGPHAFHFSSGGGGPFSTPRVSPHVSPTSLTSPLFSPVMAAPRHNSGGSPQRPLSSPSLPYQHHHHQRHRQHGGGGAVTTATAAAGMSPLFSRRPRDELLAYATAALECLKQLLEKAHTRTGAAAASPSELACWQALREGPLLSHLAEIVALVPHVGEARAVPVSSLSVLSPPAATAAVLHASGVAGDEGGGGGLVGRLARAGRERRTRPVSGPIQSAVGLLLNIRPFPFTAFMRDVLAELPSSPSSPAPSSASSPLSLSASTPSTSPHRRHRSIGSYSILGWSRGASVRNSPDSAAATTTVTTTTTVRPEMATIPAVMVSGGDAGGGTASDDGPTPPPPPAAAAPLRRFSRRVSRPTPEAATTTASTAAAAVAATAPAAVENHPRQQQRRFTTLDAMCAAAVALVASAHASMAGPGFGGGGGGALHSPCGGSAASSPTGLSGGGDGGGSTVAAGLPVARSSGVVATLALDAVGFLRSLLRTAACRRSPSLREDLVVRQGNLLAVFADVLEAPGATQRHHIEQQQAQQRQRRQRFPVASHASRASSQSQSAAGSPSPLYRPVFPNSGGGGGVSLRSQSLLGLFLPPPVFLPSATVAAAATAIATATATGVPTAADAAADDAWRHFTNQLASEIGWLLSDYLDGSTTVAPAGNDNRRNNNSNGDTAATSATAAAGGVGGGLGIGNEHPNTRRHGRATSQSPAWGARSALPTAVAEGGRGGRSPAHSADPHHAAPSSAPTASFRDDRIVDALLASGALDAAARYLASYVAAGNQAFLDFYCCAVGNENANKSAARSPLPPHTQPLLLLPGAFGVVDANKTGIGGIGDDDCPLFPASVAVLDYTPHLPGSVGAGVSAVCGGDASTVLTTGALVVGSCVVAVSPLNPDLHLRYRLTAAAAAAAAAAAGGGGGATTAVAHHDDNDNGRDGDDVDGLLPAAAARLLTGAAAPSEALRISPDTAQSAAAAAVTVGPPSSPSTANVHPSRKAAIRLRLVAATGGVLHLLAAMAHPSSGISWRQLLQLSRVGLFAPLAVILCEYQRFPATDFAAAVRIADSLCEAGERGAGTARHNAVNANRGNNNDETTRVSGRPITRAARVSGSPEQRPSVGEGPPGQANHHHHHNHHGGGGGGSSSEQRRHRRFIAFHRGSSSSDNTNTGGDDGSINRNINRRLGYDGGIAAAFGDTAAPAGSRHEDPGSAAAAAVLPASVATRTDSPATARSAASTGGGGGGMTYTHSYDNSSASTIGSTQSSNSNANSGSVNNSDGGGSTYGGGFSGHHRSSNSHHHYRYHHRRQGEPVSGGVPVWRGTYGDRAVVGSLARATPPPPHTLLPHPSSASSTSTATTTTTTAVAVVTVTRVGPHTAGEGPTAAAARTASRSPASVPSSSSRRSLRFTTGTGQHHHQQQQPQHQQQQPHVSPLLLSEAESRTAVQRALRLRLAASGDATPRRHRTPSTADPSAAPPPPLPSSVSSVPSTTTPTAPTTAVALSRLESYLDGLGKTEADGETRRLVKRLMISLERMEATDPLGAVVGGDGGGHDHSSTAGGDAVGRSVPLHL